LVLNLALYLLAAVSQQLELPPAPRGYGTSAAEVVVDAARVLDPAVIDRLNRIAFEVRAKTGGEMAIVTMPDLRGRDVADIALRIGRTWGVGSAAAAGDRRRRGHDRSARAIARAVRRMGRSEGLAGRAGRGP